LTNPYALREARNQFRALCIGSSEAFAQFRTRFLLLAHKSYLRPKDYCEELWDKITLALGTTIAAIEYQLITYNQLANCLLATDINIRWLAPKTALIARRNQSQAGQPFLTSSAHCTNTLLLA
jgi:hypothetical protein